MRARAILVEMQRRISQGPHATLGVTSSVSPEDVRAAFLALTKTFHPARFARMSTELQRHSNEVFLGIKAAHETLLRALGAPPRGGRTQQSGGMRPITAEGSSKFPAGQQPPLPRATGTEQPIRNPTPATPTPTVPRPPARPPTPAFGVRAMPVARPTPPQGVRITPMPSGSTPPQGVRMIPATPPAPRPGTAPAPLPQAIEPEVQFALSQIAARNWAAAEQTLNRLRARDPASKQYRALLFYLRGHEAESTGQSQKAAEQYERALQLDPDQAQAKTALAELQRRR